jgi:uncharacterized protein (TIGR01244 family)
MNRSLPCVPAAALVIVLAAMLSSCATVEKTGAAPAVAATSPAPAPATPAPNTKPFLERSLDAGRIVVAGQPAAADFQTFAAAGITRIVNVRTREEMAALGFDSAALAAEQEIGYVELPIAGAAAYTPELLDAFARELAAANGRVLLHCGSGSRAGLLYAAWLVRYQGKSPTEAMQTLAPLGLWPLPMERMLGEPLQLEFSGGQRPGSFESGG